MKKDGSRMSTVGFKERKNKPNRRGDLIGNIMIVVPTNVRISYTTCIDHDIN